MYQHEKINYNVELNEMVIDNEKILLNSDNKYINKLYTNDINYIIYLNLMKINKLNEEYIYLEKENAKHTINSKKTKQKFKVKIKNTGTDTDIGTDISTGTVILSYNEMIQNLRQLNLTYKKYYGSGKYSKAYCVIDYVNNKKLIIKKTKIRKSDDLLKLSDEYNIQNKIHEQYNLSPKMYFHYFYKKNNNIYSAMGMDKLNYQFYRLFNIDKLYKEFKKKNNIILNEFNKSMKIYIGNLEKLILNGILHNDCHDGNICFNDDGSIVFIDYGEYRNILTIDNVINNDTNEINNDVINKEINYNYLKYLERELYYFISMYFFYDEYPNNKKIKYEKLYVNSYIYYIYSLLYTNKYIFGYHLSYVKDKINIKVIKDILSPAKQKLMFKS